MLGKKPSSEKLCHHTGFKSPCIKDRCHKWVTISGAHPQTGENVHSEACSDTWVPLLLVDVARKLVTLDATTHNMNNRQAQDAQAIHMGMSIIAKAAHESMQDRDAVKRFTTIERRRDT